jgi:predicted nuclease of predicted toxin-antitoxin system
VSKDEDFALRVNSGAHGPQIIWIRLGNCTNKALRISLASLWPMVCAALKHGERLIEVQ